MINTVNESGDAPIFYIQQANPIVIIDEPQNMETEIQANAIESLSPLSLCVILPPIKMRITRFLASIRCKPMKWD